MSLEALITGPGRTGTTLTRNILTSWLVGDPAGRAELEVLGHLNNEIIEACTGLGLDHRNAHTWPYRAIQKWEPEAMFRRIFEERMVEVMMDAPPVVKDPRLLYTWPLAFYACRKLGRMPRWLILIDRDEEQCVLSWARKADADLGQVRCSVRFRRGRMEHLEKTARRMGIEVFRLQHPYCWVDDSAAKMLVDMAAVMPNWSFDGDPLERARELPGGAAGPCLELRLPLQS